MMGHQTKRTTPRCERKCVGARKKPRKPKGLLRHNDERLTAEKPISYWSERSARRAKTRGAFQLMATSLVE